MTTTTTPNDRAAPTGEVYRHRRQLEWQTIHLTARAPDRRLGHAPGRGMAWKLDAAPPESSCRLFRPTDAKFGAVSSCRHNAAELVLGILGKPETTQRETSQFDELDIDHVLCSIDLS
jgi:hypothetical protein